MAGVATVDGVVVAEAEVMCKLADKEEKAARSAKRRSLTMPIHPTAIVDPLARDRRERRNRPLFASSARKSKSARARA